MASWQFVSRSTIKISCCLAEDLWLMTWVLRLQLQLYGVYRHDNNMHSTLQCVSSQVSSMRHLPARWKCETYHYKRISLPFWGTRKWRGCHPDFRRLLPFLALLSKIFWFSGALFGCDSNTPIIGFCWLLPVEEGAGRTDIAVPCRGFTKQDLHLV